MGNQFGRPEKKDIRVITTMDGKIIRYRSPWMKVHEILSEYPGYELSDGLPSLRKLGSDEVVIGGKLYFLTPAKAKLLAVREPAGSGEGDTCAGVVVKIILVVGKQDMKEMMKKKGAFLDEIIPRARKGERWHRTWKPALESIPEIGS